MTTTIQNPLKVTDKCCFNYTSFETNFEKKPYLIRANKGIKAAILAHLLLYN